MDKYINTKEEVIYLLNNFCTMINKLFDEFC